MIALVGSNCRWHSATTHEGARGIHNYSVPTKSKPCLEFAGAGFRAKFSARLESENAQESAVEHIEESKPVGGGPTASKDNCQARTTEVRWKSRGRLLLFVSKE